MNPALANRVNDFIESGWNTPTSGDFFKWRRRLVALLRSAGEDALVEKLAKYDAKSNESIFWEQVRDGYVSHLEGQLLLVEAPAASATATGPEIRTVPGRSANLNKVFIVHGHDESAKESAARFIEKLGLEAVVLHERPNQGQTIIEKFENYSDVGFAVVLLTPDDVGSSANLPDKLTGRARQNVILELGYFTGKLGRKHVCGLFKPGLDIPSDFHGVLLIEMDSNGAWRTKLAQELVSVGTKIDLSGLLQT